VLAWSSVAWIVSVAAVAASGVVAAFEGHWRRSARIQLGFGTHGGMWGDALLLPVVNALAVPWIRPGWWLAVPLLMGAVASVALHAWWHGGRQAGVREHMWPSRPTGHWRSDLSWAGWCHVVYVAVELALLAAYVISAMPPPAVAAAVALLLTAHVPIGVLLPPWTATRQVFRVDLGQTAAAIALVWIVAVLKITR
jgi:hypothetical protein